MISLKGGFYGPLSPDISQAIPGDGKMAVRVHGVPKNLNVKRGWPAEILFLDPRNDEVESFCDLPPEHTEKAIASLKKWEIRAPYSADWSWEDLYRVRFVIKTIYRNHLKYRRNRAGVKDLKSDHVFCRTDGTPIKNFNNAWWAALRRAGIYDFHFLDLRHTFCSNLIMSGADLKDAKEMIGHADIAMTDRYAHLSGIYKQHLQLKLAEHYGSLPAD